MGLMTKIGSALVDAFQVNLTFLTTGFEELSKSDSIVDTELRVLVARDLPILVHKRNKWDDAEDGSRDRWYSDLEIFIARTLRPNLTTESVLARWNDSAIMRLLDSLVADEQAALARVPARVPVTGRFDSHWAT